ncbi:MAG: hypothetical protein FJ280_13205 [Planctomycetes bacterium]|nr:hypothetical protein [Planctomycetota bacterium]
MAAEKKEKPLSRVRLDEGFRGGVVVVQEDVPAPAADDHGAEDLQEDRLVDPVLGAPEADVRQARARGDRRAGQDGRVPLRCA